MKQMRYKTKLQRIRKYKKKVTAAQYRKKKENKYNLKGTNMETKNLNPTLRFIGVNK